MTDAELDGLAALDAAATPAPWQAVAVFNDGSTYRVEAGGQVLVYDEGVPSPPDAQVLVAARNALPALVAEVWRLRDNEEDALWLLAFTGAPDLVGAASAANQNTSWLRGLVRRAFEEGRTQFNEADDSWERSDARAELERAL